MELPTDFQFSQGSLQDFVDCPRRFQLRYLQRVSWPAVETEPLIENERFRKMGQLFHRLVHQQILGLPEERLLNIAACSRQGGVELQTWWQNYLSWAASLEKLEHPGKVYPEISLAGRIGGAGLTATYDAIMVDGGTDDPHITIMDWKTSRQRPRRSWLFDRLQTRVYLCLLVNAGAFLAGGKALSPDHVDMVYWFAGFPDDPEHFTYSEERYQEDRVYITGLIDQIKAVEDAKFPTRSGHGMCKFCLYRSLCERGLVPGILGESDGFEQSFIVEDVSGPDDLDLDFDQIVEIEF
jgi:CRISPR/Cas system-associated exonuclease Cas4 (RecB family)